MNIDIKVIVDGAERCYNIEWPNELRIENCFRLTELQINNFKVNDHNRFCQRDGNDIVIKFSEPNPMRWMLKLKNEYYFQRVDIQ